MKEEQIEKMELKEKYREGKEWKTAGENSKKEKEGKKKKEIEG